MPRRDGTGPAGPSGGGGCGRQPKRGSGGGKMGNPASKGPGGFCECPNCGTRMPHKLAQPCSDLKCPQCGSAMARA